LEFRHLFLCHLPACRQRQVQPVAKTFFSKFCFLYKPCRAITIMKIYNLKRSQFLPITISEAWDFFSAPRNLARITPTNVNFKMISISGGERAYPGQRITIEVNVLPGISRKWVTEITKVNAPHYFSDEQLSGPFAMFQHQHHFKEVKGGVKMTDEVNYAVPLGWLGQLANSIFVARQLNSTFDYRYKILEELFSKNR
jgi:ligand-binding SRPBCC domain-containing protein